MEDKTVLPVREKNSNLDTYDVTYTNAAGVLKTDLITATAVCIQGNFVVFKNGPKTAFMIDQRAMHSCRSVSDWFMKEKK